MISITITDYVLYYCLKQSNSHNSSLILKKITLGIKRNHKIHICIQNTWSVVERLTIELAILPKGPVFDVLQLLYDKPIMDVGQRGRSSGALATPPPPPPTISQCTVMSIKHLNTM